MLDFLVREVFEYDLPIKGPKAAIGALVKKTKERTMGRYLFGTSSPIATLKLNCTVSPTP
jgi:hypothetical protein